MDVSALDWHWSSTDSSITSQEIDILKTRRFCPTYLQFMKVEGEPELQELCMFGGKSIRFATLYLNGTAPKLAVLYPFDTLYHLVDGLCEQNGGCLYSAESDTLVTRYTANNRYLGLRIYKQVTKKLQREFDLRTEKVSDRFDASAPDFTLRSTTGAVAAVDGVGISDNGRWVVAELPGYGTARIDTDSFEVRRIVPIGPSYGSGTNPLIKYAVSSDGRYVAIAGERAGVSIVEVVDGCGDQVVAELETYFDDSRLPCPVTVVDTSRIIDKFYSAYRPRFDAAGGNVSFFALGYGGQNPRYVSIVAKGYTSGPVLDYLALGDSFTSGEGELEDVFYLQGTNTVEEKCHSSIRSYPFVFAQSVGILAHKMRSVACSGARMNDIASLNYRGQGDRLHSLGWSDEDITRRSIEILESFQPGRIAQSRFVEATLPKMVTVGIGGNDAGFMDKLRSCAMPGVCEWVSSQAMLQATANEIKELFPKLVALYETLRLQSPDSSLYAVGYPQVINTVGICDPVTAVLLDPQERVFMRQGVMYLNRIIRAAAMKANIQYVDVESSLERYQLCDGTSSVAVNGLRTGDDMAPIAKLPMLKIIGNESFHPTPIGHGLIGEAVANQYLHISEHECICDDLEIEASEYWKDEYGAQTRQVSTKLIASDHIEPSIKTMQIALPDFSVIPGSKIRIELHSERVLLGEHTAGDNGELSAEVSIPGNTMEGIHALHVYGTSFEATPVDYYDIVSYGYRPDDSSHIMTHQYNNKGVDKISTNSNTESSTASINQLNILHSSKVLGASNKNTHSNGGSDNDLLNAVIVTVFCTVAVIFIYTLLKIARANSTQQPGG